jgi:hypothetical protein
MYEKKPSLTASLCKYREKHICEKSGSMSYETKNRKKFSICGTFGILTASMFIRLLYVEICYELLIRA